MEGVGSPPVVRLSLTLIATITAACALAAAEARAASSYCSPSGDYCYSSKRESGVVVLRFQTFSFSGSVKVCVRSPGGTRDCRAFKLGRRGSDVMGFARRWSRHFPRRGGGTHEVTFEAFDDALGPGSSFRA